MNPIAMYAKIPQKLMMKSPMQSHIRRHGIGLSINTYMHAPYSCRVTVEWKQECARQQAWMVSVGLQWPLVVSTGLYIYGVVSADLYLSLTSCLH